MELLNYQYYRIDLPIEEIANKIKIKNNDFKFIEDININDYIPDGITPNILIYKLYGQVPNYNNIFPTVKILITNGSGLDDGLWNKIPDHVEYIIVNNEFDSDINEIYLNNKNSFDFIEFEDSEKKIEILLELIRDNNLNKINILNQTILHGVCFCQMIDEALKLIDIMSDDIINKTDIYKSTALQWAFLFIHNDKLSNIALKLIDRMSDDAINNSNRSGLTALHLAASRGLNDVVLKLLGRMNIETINKWSNNGETALFYAINSRNQDNYIALKLIEIMSDEAINKNDFRDATALSHACIRRKSIVALRLIERMNNESINKMSISGLTALDIAIKMNLTDIIEKIKEKIDL